MMRPRLNRPIEEIEREAIAKAAHDLRNVFIVITEGGVQDLLTQGSGSASLVGVAEALYRRHREILEHESTIYEGEELGGLGITEIPEADPVSYVRRRTHRQRTSDAKLRDVISKPCVHGYHIGCPFCKLGG